MSRHSALAALAAGLLAAGCLLPPVGDVVFEPPPGADDDDAGDDDAVGDDDDSAVDDDDSGAPDDDDAGDDDSGGDDDSAGCDEEICNGIDDDCDDLIDEEGCPAECTALTDFPPDAPPLTFLLCDFGEADEKDRHDARTFCTEEVAGYILAAPDFEGPMGYLRQQLYDSGIVSAEQQWWVSLHDLDGDGTWAWGPDNDNSVGAYDNWALTEPDGGQCAWIDTATGVVSCAELGACWDAVPCTATGDVICMTAGDGPPP